jgi:hypothetical protein
LSLPLVVTNLPAGPLVTANFTVQGRASTNATLVGSIKGKAISNVMWRIEESAEGFTNAAGTTAWSAQVSLTQGTNTFESYVQYVGGQRSWTNRVTLVCLGSTPPPRLSFGSKQPLTANGLDVTLEASPGLNYRIEVTTNLVDWTLLTNITVGTNSTLNFLDHSATNRNRRFYRAVTP